MGILQRGFKNAFRNSIRTISIVLILGLSIGLAVVMLVSRQAVISKIDSVKSSIGNTITVSPAGVRGFEGGGTLLAAENIAILETIEGVKSVTSTLSGRLTPGTDTALVASLEAGNFGGGRSHSSGSTTTPEGTNTQTFAMPINITGTNDHTNLQSLGVNSLIFTAGEPVDSSSDAYVAMIGTDLATKNDLSVGSTFLTYGQTITVTGIYDAGNKFTNSTLILPLATLQSLTSQGGVSSAIVQTDSVDTLSAVQERISAELGDSVDIASNQDSIETVVAPLENIRSISGISLIGSIAAGAVIILLTMTMIVRERRREIGILKAIGATNTVVTTQFVIEAVTLTLMGTFIGVIVGFLGSNPMIKLLVQNTTATSQTTPGSGLGGGMGRAMQFAGQGMQSVRDIQAVVGLELIIYGLGAALLIAVIGSAIPAFAISKIRPADVMRAE
jgi:putative ABC transport system permease protein